VAPLARGPEPVGLASWNFNFEIDSGAWVCDGVGVTGRTTIALDPKKHLALRLLALKRGVPMAELVREAVDRILAEKGGALMYSSSVPSSLEVAK
jgi:hypothetical protein